MDNEVDVHTTNSESFSEEQRTFLKDLKKDVDFNQLKMYGPASNKHIELTLDDSDYVIEEYTFREKVFLEISERVAEEDGDETNEYFKKILTEADLKLCPNQISKSDWVMGS